MEQLEDLFGRFGSAGRGSELTLEGMLVALLFAFSVGQMVAYVYHRTHGGLSYSRAFTQSLVLLVIIATLVMFVIGNDIMAAFGLIGALAIIRFRNVLKDTRDTAFVFMSLILGMAIGAGRHGTALVGGSFLLLTAAWLNLTAFGTRGRFDGHLSYNTSVLADEVATRLKQITAAYCRRMDSVAVSDTGGVLEHVFQVRLRDRTRGSELLEHLRELEGVGEVCLVLRDGHAEL
jgi:uncharacterized protein DUF4956